MISKNTKVVFVDKNIIDNTIYTVIDGAYDYDNKVLFYVISGKKLVTVLAEQIRPATQVEIDNGLKFDPIEVKTVVAYVSLLDPDYLLEVKEYDEVSLMVKAIQCYTKTEYHLHIATLRPARIKERECGRRITLYNKDLYLSYMNPFMVNDLYNVDKPETIYYPNKLCKLGLVVDKRLTVDGQRLYDDIDFQYLQANMYDLTMIKPITTHVATDKDGTVTEFALRPNLSPMFDDVNGKWYIIPNSEDRIVSIDEVVGMMSPNDYINSLRKVN
jgi:phage pi2 protein 07